jgi:hypothetical protein
LAKKHSAQPASTSLPTAGGPPDDGDTAAIMRMLTLITAKQRRQIRKLLESMIEG